MVSIKTNSNVTKLNGNGGVASVKTVGGTTKLNTGNGSNHYRSTNKTMRTMGSNNPIVNPPVNHFNLYNTPNHTKLDKVAGSGPYMSGSVPTPSNSSTPWIYFGQSTLVPANAETTICSYTVAANQLLYCQGFQACGDADAMYTLYVNNQIVTMSRTTPANLNAYVNLLGGTPSVNPGITIKLTVISTLGGISFNGTMLGYYFAS